MPDCKIGENKKTKYKFIYYLSIINCYFKLQNGSKEKNCMILELKQGGGLRHIFGNFDMQIKKTN